MANFKIRGQIVARQLKTRAAFTVNLPAKTNYQGVEADVELAAGVGSSTAAEPGYLGAMMGNTIAKAALTATKNNVFSILGKYSVEGAGASTYMKGAVMAEIGEASSDSDGMFVGIFGGDAGGTTRARSVFTVDWQNSLIANYVNFGLDLQGAGAHDGFLAPYYADGQIRLGGRVKKANGAIVAGGDDVVIRTSEVAPVDGASGTGVGVTGVGSLIVNTATGKWYRNEGTKASPTWVLLSTA